MVSTFPARALDSNPSSSGKFISILVARLNPNPILKVLSSIRANRVRALLMGGQACVFYGAAEFSRDTDLAILASSENFARLNKTLTDLRCTRNCRAAIRGKVSPQRSRGPF